MALDDMTPTFVALFSMTWMAGLLAGSTIQWVMARGLFKKGFRDKTNEYNIIVFVAAVSSGLLAPFNFFNYYLAPDSDFGFMIYLLINWMTMTHSSIMVVSKKLSLTYRNPDVTWKRLLLINAAMLPVSLLVCVTWGGAYISDDPIFIKISKVVEPIQMSLWGIIEFVLSGLFIVKMWKFQWTVVERQGIFVLVLVGVCDVMSVVSNVILGDYESTVVKSFVYCLRIRLEVGVLCTMADFIKEKSRGNLFQSKKAKFMTSLTAGKSSTFTKSGEMHASARDMSKQWGLVHPTEALPKSTLTSTCTAPLPETCEDEIVSGDLESAPIRETCEDEYFSADLESSQPTPFPVTVSNNSGNVEICQN